MRWIERLSIYVKWWSEVCVCVCSVPQTANWVHIFGANKNTETHVVMGSINAEKEREGQIAATNVRLLNYWELWCARVCVRVSVSMYKYVWDTLLSSDRLINCPVWICPPVSGSSLVCTVDWFATQKNTSCHSRWPIEFGARLRRQQHFSHCIDWSSQCVYTFCLLPISPCISVSPFPFLVSCII